MSVASRIELPELVVDHEARSPDIVIDDARSQDDQGYELTIDDVATFVIRGGKSIRVDAFPGVDPRNVRIFLLGSAMGVLLHQRGLLPLHANAVVVDGVVAAFTGASGAGKSTLAAWFHDVGFDILADDVCVLDISEERGPIALPGLPRLRLWDDALQASGRDPSQHPLSFFSDQDDKSEKRDVRIDDGRIACSSKKLGAIYVLDSGPSASIERLRGTDAVDAIMSNTYRGMWIGSVGNPEIHFGIATKIASNVPVYRWRRTKDRGNFDRENHEILDHLRGTVPIG